MSSCWPCGVSVFSVPCVSLSLFGPFFLPAPVCVFCARTHAFSSTLLTPRILSAPAHVLLTPVTITEAARALQLAAAAAAAAKAAAARPLGATGSSGASTGTAPPTARSVPFVAASSSSSSSSSTAAAAAAATAHAFAAHASDSTQQEVRKAQGGAESRECVFLSNPWLPDEIPCTEKKSSAHITFHRRHFQILDNMLLALFALLSRIRWPAVSVKQILNLHSHSLPGCCKNSANSLARKTVRRRRSRFQNS